MSTNNNSRNSNSNPPRNPPSGRGSSRQRGGRKPRRGPQPPARQPPAQSHNPPLDPEIDDMLPEFPSTASQPFNGPPQLPRMPTYQYDSGTSNKVPDGHVPWDKLPEYVNHSGQQADINNLAAELDPRVLHDVDVSVQMARKFWKNFAAGRDNPIELQALLYRDRHVIYTYGHYLAQCGLKYTSCLYNREMGDQFSPGTMVLLSDDPHPPYAYSLYVPTSKQQNPVVLRGSVPSHKPTDFAPIQPAVFNLKSAFPCVPMNSKSFATLIRLIPNVRFIKKDGTPHPHPLAHVTRYYAAYYALNVALQSLPKNKQVSVVDIGSKMSMWNRHPFSRGIWGTCPIVTNEDILRHADDPVGRFCRCKFPNTCNDCDKHDAALLIHSIYYLSRDHVVSLAARHGKVYAVLHDFPELAGTIHEARYQRTTTDVIMTADTDRKAYRHPPCDWVFSQNSASYSGNHMVWQRVAEIAGHYIYKFTSVQHLIAQDFHLEHPSQKLVAELSRLHVGTNPRVTGPSLISIDYGGSDRVLPVSLLHEAKAYLHGNDLTPTKLRACQIHLTTVARNKYGDVDGVRIASELGPTIVAIACEQVVEDNRATWSIFDRFWYRRKDYAAIVRDLDYRPGPLQQFKAWFESKHLDPAKIFPWILLIVGFVVYALKRRYSTPNRTVAKDVKTVFNTMVEDFAGQTGMNFVANVMKSYGKAITPAWYLVATVLESLLLTKFPWLRVTVAVYEAILTRSVLPLATHGILLLMPAPTPIHVAYDSLCLAAQGHPNTAVVQAAVGAVAVPFAVTKVLPSFVVNQPLSVPWFIPFQSYFNRFIQTFITAPPGQNAVATIRDVLCEETICTFFPKAHLILAGLETLAHQNPYPLLLHGFLYYLQTNKEIPSKYRIPAAFAVHIVNNLYAFRREKGSITAIIGTKSWRRTVAASPLPLTLEGPLVNPGPVWPPPTTLSYCAQGKTLPDLSPGSSVKVPYYTRCSPTTGTALMFFGICRWTPIAARSCTHNELAAVRGRVTLLTTELDPQFDPLPLTEVPLPSWKDASIDFSEWWDHLDPKQKRLYSEAYDAPNRHALSRSKLFVKVETIIKGHPSHPSFTDLTPRAIQSVQPHLSVSLGPHTWAYSKLLEQYILQNSSCYVMVYSLNPDQLGQLLDDRLPGIKPSLFVSADGIKQDAHERPWMVEHLYKILGVNSIPALKGMSEADQTVHGVSMSGVRYSAPHGIRSGSPYTTLIHCTFWYILHEAWRKNILPTLDVTGSHLCLNKGDDLWFALGYGSNSRRVWDSFQQYAKSAGTSLTTQFTTDVRFSEFLAARPYLTPGGYAWAAKPGRILTKIGWTSHPHKVSNLHRRALDIAICFRHYHPLPVLGTYFVTLESAARAALKRNKDPYNPSVEQAQLAAFPDLQYKFLGSNRQHGESYRQVLIDLYSLDDAAINRMEDALREPTSYPWVVCLEDFDVIVKRDLELPDYQIPQCGLRQKPTCFIIPPCSITSLLMQALNDQSMPRHSRSIITNLIKDREIEPQAVEFLINALDPFHDTVTAARGYPDQASTQTLPFKVTVTQEYSFPEASDTWECVVTFLPLAVGNGGGPLRRLTIEEGYITTVDTTYSIRTGVNVFKGDPGMDWTTGTVVDDSSLSLPNEYIVGQWRLVGVGYEVVNTTSELYKQGAVTTARVPSSITHSSLGFKVDETTFIPPRPFDAVAMPPGTQRLLTQFPGSVTWEAAKGVYAVPILNNTSNPIRSTGLNGVVMMPPPSASSGVASHYLGYGSGYQSHSTVPIDYALPYDTTVSHFVGLSPETTLTVTVHYYVERVPDVTEISLVPLVQPACPYDPTTLEIYTRAAQLIPCAVPAGENPLGEWFNTVMKAVGSVAPAVARALGGPIPGMIAKTVDTVLNGPETLPRAEIIAGPQNSGRPRRQKSSRAATKRLTARENRPKRDANAKKATQAPAQKQQPKKPPRPQVSSKGGR